MNAAEKELAIKQGNEALAYWLEKELAIKQGNEALAYWLKKAEESKTSQQFRECIRRATFVRQKLAKLR
jgi:hypothetical protein